MTNERLRLQPNTKVIVDERGMMDIPFLVLTLLLLAIGLVMLFSASYARAYTDEGNSTYYFARQAIFAVFGVAAMLFITRINYQIWRMLAFPMLAVSVLLLVLVLLMGSSGGGAQRWIVLGGIRFQPSEVTKLAIIVCFATLISSYKEKMQTFRYGVLPFAGILCVIVGLLALQPHLSAIVIIGMIGALMMFLGGTKVRWFVIGAGVAVAFGYIYLTAKGYALDRILTWQDPFSDPSDDGYQTVQSLYAIGSGGLFGLGLGKSRQKYLYLPEEHKDYIFAIVLEELGLIGGLLIILLFILLIVRGYWLAMHARDRFGALLIAGIMTKLALQVFFNIGVVTNFLPATGISLPFFSYGGTALMLQLFEMGMVLQVSRQNSGKLL